MAKRTKKQKRRERDQRKEAQRLEVEREAFLDRTPEELPDYDVTEICECGLRVRVWESGLALNANKCCFELLQRMKMDRYNSIGVSPHF